MKKIITLSIISFLMLCFSNVKAQTVVFSSDFENWNGNIPFGWEGSRTSISTDSVKPYTVSAHSPTHACQLKNTTATHKRFATHDIKVTIGTVYNISFWVRGHGSTRLGFYDGRAGSSSGYDAYHAYLAINSTTWTHYTDTVVCKNTKSSGEFIWDVKSTFSDMDHLQIDDICIYSGTTTTSPLITIYNPYYNSTTYSPNVPVEFYTGNFVTSVDGYIKYSVDGGSTNDQHTSSPIMLSGLITGTHYVTLQLVDNTGTAFSPNVAATDTFKINTIAPNVQTIHDIQYSTASPANSSFVNTVVTTSGIVTATYSQGYFIQNGTNLWSGLYVYDNINTAAQGDSIKVTGTIQEYYGYTELSWLEGFTILSSGNPVPTPILLTGSSLKDTVVSEPYEGMLVKVANEPCSAITSATYGEWQLFQVDTTNIGGVLYKFTPTVGINYDVTGVVYLTYGHDYIEPRYTSDVVVHGASINELTTDVNSISVYPNPASSVLFLNNIEGIETIRISNILGETIDNIKVNSGNVAVDVSNLSNGIYFATLINKNGMMFTKKFSKE